MIQTSKRLELLFLAVIPSSLTFLLAIVFMVAKHINGLDRFMPLLPLIPLFYWGLVQARDMPYWFLFILGVTIDSVTGLPLGVTSLMFLFFLILLHTQRKYIYKEGFFIKWVFFAGILAVTAGFNWLLLTFFYSHRQMLEPVIMQWVLTVCCYPVMHKGFDEIYEYIHSRRWQILHGHR